MSAAEKFLRYVTYDTQSAEDAGQIPSTDKQLVLAGQLAKELTELGVQDVTVDDHGYVFGTIPANIEKKVPVLGLIAHMDTAPVV